MRLLVVCLSVRPTVRPDRRCWGQSEQVLRLFGREILFEVFQPL